jgi:hypothetical protein
MVQSRVAHAAGTSGREGRRTLQRLLRGNAMTGPEARAQQNLSSVSYATFGMQCWHAMASAGRPTLHVTHILT